MAMTQVFDILAEPNRRRILEELQGGELTVSDLVDRLRVSQPTVSKHLKVLRDADLVAVRVDAQRRRYRLRPEPLRELDAWLARFRPFWADRLDALEQYLNKEE